MSNELILRPMNIPEMYLLARVLRTLSVSVDFLRKFQSEISALVFNELKSFGGNINQPEDKRRAEFGVLKLINLGLEKAADIRGDADKKYDFEMARNILTNKPAALIYAVGKKLFDSDKNFASKVIQDVQIEASGLWFRLISASEFNILTSATNLDCAKGTLDEHEKVIAMIVKLINKLRIAPFLPIKPYVLRSHQHWGSTQKGNYPIENGIIDCFLLSLTIACMFRTDIEMNLNRKQLKEFRGFAKLAELEKEKERKKVWAKNAINFRQYMEEEQKSRYSRENKSRQQWQFMADILTVSAEEVSRFVDTLFFEQKKFESGIKDIEKKFFYYFEVVRKTLFVEKPENFSSIIVDALQSTIKKVREETHKFYMSIDDPDLSNIAIARFWEQRISFESDKIIELAKNTAIAINTPERMNIANLANMSIDFILKATRYFVFWACNDQTVFCKNFNPNVVLKNSGSARNLLKLLKNMSLNSSTGWDEDLSKEIKRSDAFNKTKEMIINEPSGENWTEKLLDKMTWDITHPSIIVEMWQLGSDQIRDAMFKKKEDFKISMPALKTYYLFEHQDLRLLAFVLQKLINEDKLRPREKTWRDLLVIAETMPHAKIIIKMKYKEEMKK